MMIPIQTEIMMKNNVEKSYGVDEKTIEFLVHCIDVAQESLLIKPDKEEMDLISRISRKHDELQDDKYDSMMN